MRFIKRRMFLLLLVIFFIILGIAQFIGFDAYIVDEAHISDDQLHLSLLSTDSSACITGYRYMVKGNTIELKVFAGGPLLYSPKEYSARLDILLPLTEELRNQDIEIHRRGLFGGECLKIVDATDTF